MNFDKTVLDTFTESCTKFAHQDAFSCMGQSLTYAELDRQSANFAAYLQHHTSLQAGDRVALQLPNLLQYPVALFGVLRAGMIVVNTNPLYTAREVKHQLNDAGAKAVVVLANIADTLASVVADTAVEQVIVTEIGDMHGPVKGRLLNFAVKHLKKMVPAFSFSSSQGFSAALKLGAKSRPEPVDVNPGDVAVLQYTGGTTGVAKGAMLTHRNLVANMLQVKAHFREFLSQSQGAVVAPLPLYHIYAFTMHCMVHFSHGHKSLLIPNPRDLDAFVKALQNETIGTFIGINTLFNALVAHKGFTQLDFSQLKITSSGGMALTRETARQWESLTGCRVSEGYGLTETSPVVSANQLGCTQLGTIGTPVPQTEVRVIDEMGQELPRGEPGELCVRGPQVMKGYWRRPEATAEVLSEDGWLKTGDMAVIQADGYLRIVDRKKDMIVVSGFNVYPNEVEDVVCSHPDIVEAAAIGVDDSNTGEAVKLFVVRGDEGLTTDRVREFCAQNLTAYKVPKQVVFIDELPKSNVGKVLRRELKERELAAQKSRESEAVGG